MAERYKNFIDGRWVEAKSRKTFENRNPANRNDLIGLFPLSGPEDVHRAVSAAKMRSQIGAWCLRQSEEKSSSEWANSCASAKRKLLEP